MCLGGTVDRETAVVAGIFVASAVLKVSLAIVIAVTEDGMAVLTVEAVVLAGIVMVNVD